MAQSGSSLAARWNERIASGWLNDQHMVRPWSKYRWASGELVVTLWCRSPRWGSSGALPSTPWSAAARPAPNNRTPSGIREDMDESPERSDDSRFIRKHAAGGQKRQ